MNIIDAQDFLAQRQNNLTDKPNVIPVSLKRLQTKTGDVTCNTKIHFAGQNLFVRMDTLRVMTLTKPDGSKYDLPVINIIDSNGGDCGWIPVELFFC